MGITNGSLIKRKDTWAWKYRVDGESRWESLKVSSKHDAEMVRQQRIAEYHQDRAQFVREGINPTIEEFESQYFPWAEQHKRARTLEIEQLYWGQFVAFTRAKRLGDITKRHVERFKSKLRRRGASGRPLAEQSINVVLTHLQAIFNHAIKQKFFTGENPVLGIARYKITRKMPEFLSEENISALLETAQAHSQAIYWVYLLGIYTGMRKNEIVNTRWEWLDFENTDGPVIRVKEHEGFEIKDHEERSVPMSSKVVKALKPHRQDEGFLFESAASNKGVWRYRYEPKRAFDAVKNQAGVPSANFLIMRHTFASWHVMNGTDISKVSRWLGHAKIDTTMRHYAGLKSYDRDIENF